MANLPWATRLQKMLYGLRTTPSLVTGKTPAELLNNRRFRTKFDRFHPLAIKEKVTEDVQENETKRVREFKVGEKICFRNYRGGPRWLQGTIIKKIGALRYKIKQGKKIFIRHVNQMLGFARNEDQNTDAHSNAKERPTRDSRESRHNEPDQGEGGEDEAYGTIRIPPPTQWAEMIGVKGPEECELQDVETTFTRSESNSNKIPPSCESPPSAAPSLKKMALQENASSDFEAGCEGDEFDSADSQ